MNRMWASLWSRRQILRATLLAAQTVGLAACAANSAGEGDHAVAVTTRVTAPAAPSVQPSPSTSPPPLSPPGQERGAPAVGAIRWDAWIGEMPSFGDATSQNRAGLVVEQTLAPAHWHSRLPFYAQEVAPNQVLVRATTQSIIDREIEFAMHAGLSYWAFVYYPPGSGLDTARNLYLSSKLRSAIRYCLIFDNLLYLKDELSSGRLMKHFLRPEYQTVLDQRPLLFLLNIAGSNEAEDQDILATVGALRLKARSSGIANPYIVMMGGVRLVKAYQLDAVSTYAEVASGGMPYARLARNAEVRWDGYRAMHQKVIPWVTTGWDPRPRIEHPTPWVTYPTDSWVQSATPDEIGVHLQHALQWSAKHPDANEANVIIIYAWNEFDEGGWLCPTLRDGTQRMDAVAHILGVQP